MANTFLNSDPFNFEDPDFRKRFIAQSQGQGDIMDFDLKSTQDAFSVPPKVESPTMQLLGAQQKPFNIQDTELYKASQKAIMDDLSGTVPGFDEQANISREALKAAQAQRATATREALIGSGFRDAGKYLEEGYLIPEEQQMREREAFERQLIADKAAQSAQLRQAGQGAANNLLGLLASNEQFKDKETFDKWAIEAGYDENARQRLWQSVENERARQSGEKIAFADLDVKLKSLAQEGMNFKDEMAFKKYALDSGYSEADSARAWQSIENEKQLQIQEKIAKMQITSTEKIAADEMLIKKQGLSLEEASLYGYTDANGNHISGQAEISAMEFGLQQKTLDLQQKELFGFTDEMGVYHKGKYDLLTDTQKMDADRLYGYAIKDNNGNIIGTVPGELQLQKDKLDIEKHGMSLQDAALFGYDKDTDGDGKTDTHIDGQLDLNMKKFGLDEKTYADNRLKMFGGTDPLTGQPIKGEMQIAAEELGLKEQSLQLQKQELFGYTDENGVFHEGKYGLLTKEQQLKTDEMYGYKDPQTGEWVPGKWDQVKETINLQYQNDLKKLETQFGYDISMQTLNGDIEKSLKTLDYENAQMLQKLKYEKEMEMQQKELDYKKLLYELEKQGFDMKTINDQIAAGNLTPDAAIEYMKKNFPEELKNILKEPDPNAWQDAIDEDWMMQQYQFATTHGLDIKTISNYDQNGNFVGLKDEYLKQLQDHLNNTIYLTDDSPTGQLISEFKSGDEDPVEYFSGKTVDDPEYKAFLNDNSVIAFNLDVKLVGDKPSTERYVFTTMPSVGGFFKYNGAVYRLDSKRTIEQSGHDNKEYTVTNILTGKIATLTTQDSVGMESPKEGTTYIEYLKGLLDATKG